MGRRILVADDSITIQKVVELTFSEFDDVVVSAGNGALAIQHLSQEPFDIALLDAVMPERSGYDVCAHIRKDERLSWMPVLLMSGTFETYDEGRAKQAGADGHIRKPFESRSLMAKVEELVAAKPRPGAPPAVPRPRPAPPEPAVPAQRPAPASPMGPPVARPAQPAPQRPAAAAPAPPAPAPGIAAAPAPQPAPSTPTPPAPGPASSGAPVPAPTRGPARPSAPSVPAAPGAAPAGASASAARPATTAPPVAPGQAPSAIPSGGASIPPEVMERVAREVVSAVADKIVREVAWEVIPDLAEAIVRRRIRELEDEAERSNG